MPPRPDNARALRRTFARLAAVAGTITAAWGQATVPAEVVLAGLTNPTGVAVRSAPRSAGVEVLVADSGQIVASVWKKGRALPPRVLVDGVPSGPLALGWLSKNTLLTAASTIASYELMSGEAASEPLAVARPAEQGGAIRSTTANARFVYAVGDGTLLRSRRVGERLTALRTVSTELAQPTAVVINPRGYLVVLYREEAMAKQADWRLAYLDPEQPEKPGATLRVRGLHQPIQLAIGRSGVSSEGLLYVLDAGTREPGNSGVYRIDSMLGGSERPAAIARQVVEIKRPTAFAIGPDRACFVASGAEGGQVLRYCLD